MTKIKKIIKNHHLLSFLFPMVIFSLALYFSNVFPINPSGNQSLLIMDFWDQYYPFIYEFNNRLRTGGSLLWSWNLGGGINYLFHYAYYLTSPFNILAAFFPSTWLREILTVFVIIKIGLAGMFMSLYLNYITKKKDLLLPAFSSMYALCGWILAYYHNIMWLDVAYITPLVVVGAHQLILEKNYKLYTVTFALALFLNFHIAFMLAIFIILYFFVVAISEYRDIRNFLISGVYLFLATIIAAGMMLWLLWPAFDGMQNMYRETLTSIPPFEWIHNTYTFISSFMTFSPQTVFHFHGGGPANIYSGLVCIMLIFIFLISSKIKIQERIAYAFVFIFILASLDNHFLHFIWHGFSFTFGFPGRFSFLLSFLLITLAYRAYLYLMEVDFKKKDLLVMALGPIPVLIASYFSWQEEHFIIWNFLLTVAYLIVFSLLYISKKEGSTQEIKAIKYILILTISFEIVFTAYSSITAWRHYWIPSYVNEDVSKVASERSSGFYRTEFSSQTHTNYTFASSYLNINQVAIFSSSANGATGRYMRDLGLPSNLYESRYLYFETSPLTNAFLNIHYIIDRENNPASNNHFFERVSQIGSVVLLQNNYSLPLGFMANHDLANWKGDPNHLFASQNKLFRAATGLEGDLFHIHQLTYDSEDGNYHFDFITPNEGDLFSVSHLRTDTRVYEYPQFIRNIGTTYPAIHHLGTFEADTHIRLDFSTDNVIGERTIEVAIIDRELFAQGHALLNESTLDITSFSDIRINGTINIVNSGLLYTSIPYDNGNWRVYIEGERVDVALINGAMVGVELEAGSYEIEFRYVNTAFNIGLGISLISFAIFILPDVAKLYKKQKKALKPFKN